jgi:hypothetical protein
LEHQGYRNSSKYRLQSWGDFALTVINLAAKTNVRQSDAMGSPTRSVQFHRDDLEPGLSPAKTAIRDPTGAPEKRFSAEPESVPIAPALSRRTSRLATTRTFRTVDAVHLRPSWHAGQEPGLDPSKPNGGRAQTPILHEECQITVVDYSEEDIRVRDFDNAGLIDFLEEPQEDWIKCRWINVNGLSWDVVQALGNHKNLHKLAIEDLVNTNNRTKADW